MSQPLSHPSLVAKRPQVPGAGAQRLGKLSEGEQPVIGVRTLGEPAQHGWHELPLDLNRSRGTVCQCLDVPQGRTGVLETEYSQALLGCIRGKS